VLGLDEPLRVHRTVAEALHGPKPAAGEARSRTTVFELISPPPSLPGLRLQRALDRVLARAGVDIITGAVTGAQATGSPAGGPPERVETVAVLSGGRTVRVRAVEFVLAAGRFAAGGLASDDEGLLSEPVFGLDVFAPPPPGWPPEELPVGRRRAREMVWARFRSRHPVFEAGLAVDEEWRPVAALHSGPRDAPYANLRAAGSIIGGYNHFADGAGCGAAAATGFAAGRRAAAAVRASRERRDTA